MRQRTEGVFPVLDHQVRLKTLELKMNNYSSNIGRPSPQKSKSVEHYDKLRRRRQHKLQEQNRQLVNRIIHSNNKPEFNRNDSCDVENKLSVEFYVRRNMLRQKLLYKQNLKIIDRLTNCQSEVARLGQCWIDLGCQSYSKVHSKYRKERGHLIWRKLELFNNAGTPRSLRTNRTRKNNQSGCFLTGL